MTDIIYYFAYGSNLMIDRLQTRVGRVQSPTLYTLKDWELTFDAGNWMTDAYANIQPKKGGFVEGVLYPVTTTQSARLDAYEQLYDKHFFIVDGKICFTYVAHSNKKDTPTSHYLSVILAGAETFMLKTTIDKVTPLLKKAKSLERSKRFFRNIKQKQNES